MTDFPCPFARVRDLSRTVMREATYVRIHRDAVTALAERVKADPPKRPAGRNDTNVVEAAARELVASSINYAYWYGRSDIRPGGASAHLLYDHLRRIMDQVDDWPTRIQRLATRLTVTGFPLMDRRIAHLDEMLRPRTHESLEAVTNAVVEMEARSAVRSVIAAYPGFAADPFLKRAFLFALQLHRATGWAAGSIDDVPIPVDYQVPNVLRHHGVLEYSAELAAAVDGEIVLPAGGPREVEIRAATVLAGDRLADATGLSPGLLDLWLWHRRDRVEAPFHLTRTTHY